MYRYEGLIIHESHDDDGILEVIETKGIRSLHFGSSSRQSSINLKDPERLELDYVRAMMAWQLFKPMLNSAMVIGLGGGSLTKYLLQHFSAVQIKVIEYRKSVVKIARSYFDLPLDPRLKIVVDDGGAYMRKRADALIDRYELLFLDAFDHEGMAETLRHEAFFDACKNALTSDGIMVINLWASDKALFEQVAWWLSRSFNGRLLFLPVAGKGNVIGFAFREGVSSVKLKTLRERALALEAQYDMEYPDFLKAFKRHNQHSPTQIIIP